MDRRRRRALALGLVLTAPAALGAAASVAPPLRAFAWLPSGTDPVSALDTPPPECLALPSDPESAYRVEVGRAAFRTPMLLGGQAARSGVSCDSCHQAGRANPHFEFPGVSGGPGTADVTSSVFSSKRGDGVDNPRPIPDLGGAKGSLKVSQEGDGQPLATFVRGLIVEEFDGPEPDPAVLAGVAAYVRALSPGACGTASPKVTLHSQMDEVRRAATTAGQALARGERATALLMIASARSQLGLVDERFAGAGLKEADLSLRQADEALAAIAGAMRSGRAAQGPLADWISRTSILERRLSPFEARSLFDAGRLRAAALRWPSGPQE